MMLLFQTCSQRAVHREYLLTVWKENCGGNVISGDLEVHCDFSISVCFRVTFKSTWEKAN